MIFYSINNSIPDEVYFDIGADITLETKLGLVNPIRNNIPLDLREHIIQDVDPENIDSVQDVVTTKVYSSMMPLNASSKAGYT